MANIMICSFATILLSVGVVYAAPYVSDQIVHAEQYPLLHQAGPAPSQLFPTHGKPQHARQHHFAEKFPFDPSTSVLWGGGVVGTERRQPSAAFQGGGNRRPSRQDNGGEDSFVFPDDPPPPVDRPSTTRRPSTRTTTNRPPPTPPTTLTPGTGTTIANCGCPSTPEFNPVCGTNAVTYGNPGKLKCANSCGLAITLQHYGPCVTTTTSTITTPSS